MGSTPTIIKTVDGHPGFLYFYMVSLIGIALIRTIYALFRTKDPNFLLFTLYGFIHIFLLLPTRLYALCTLRRTKWGTR